MGEVRLVDGNATSNGVVELCFKDQWTKVCATEVWSESEAMVVCRQLGLNTTGKYYALATYYLHVKFMKWPEEKMHWHHFTSRWVVCIMTIMSCMAHRYCGIRDSSGIIQYYS